MASAIPNHPETALSKTSQEFAREIAKLEREKAELQCERDKLVAACEKANLATKQKKATELERQQKERWEAAGMAVVTLLAIPAISVAITLFTAQAVAGWRMLIWAIVAVRG